MWTASPEWKGETAYLICGGPSVADQNLELLRGRKVIVVNSSCYAVPWADILFFGDYDRWGPENSQAVKSFGGRVISALEKPPMREGKILVLHRPAPKDTPEGLSSDPSEVWFRRTSTRGAVNLLCHLGVNRIVTLGLDGGPDKSGRIYHHTPHSHGTDPSVWKPQREELAGIVGPLRERGVTLLNASPGSAVKSFPIVSLESCL